MKNLFLFTCLWVFSFVSHAGIEMKSFYFKSMTSELQVSSAQQLNELKELMNMFNIQFIEFNAFTESSQFNKAPQQLAEKRIQYFIATLALENEEIALNAYGNRRIAIDFSPQNWERMDIYFSKTEKQLPPLVEQPKKHWETDPYYTNTPPELSYQEPTRVFNPVIQFGGGKTKLTATESNNDLQVLLDTLIAHPELNANIRGHVCCEHNNRVSKKRAKFVYKYLIENGVNANRLTFEGMSFHDPVVFPERNSYERSLNRRVDVVFSTPDAPLLTTAQN